MQACPSCGTSAANRAKFCPSCGTPLGRTRTAVPRVEAPTATASAADTPTTPDTLSSDVEPVRAAGRGSRPPVEWVAGGDWRTPALVAGLTALVAYAASVLANSYLIWLGSDPHHSASGVFRSGVITLAWAFGSPVFGHGNGSAGGGGSVGMAPLPISLLGLAVFALAFRSAASADRPDRTVTAARSAVLTAFVLALIGFGGFATFGPRGDQLHVSTSPGRIFGWSLLFFGLVALAVATRPIERLRERTETDPRWQRLADEWWLPIKGAAVTLGLAIALGWIAGVCAAVAEAGTQAFDVVKALPVLLAYFVNLGLDVMQFAMGGALHAGVGAGDATFSLWHRDGAPAGYFGLLLLMPIAIAAGSTWIFRHGDPADATGRARACYRMALPAVLAYLVLAIAGRVGFSAAGSSGSPIGTSGHAGPQILLGAVILAAWFLVGGFLMGRFLSERSAAPPSSGPHRSAAWIRRPLPTAAVAVVSLGVLALVGIGGAATADTHDDVGDFGVASLLLLFSASADSGSSDGGSASIEPAPAVPPPSLPSPIAVPPVTSNDPFTAADKTLAFYALAEDIYRAKNPSYTRDIGVLQQQDVQGLPATTQGTVTIPRADASSFCIEYFSDTGQGSFTYDSNDRIATPGATC
ncbi:MAG: zinc-ribbon domain-containing protein [Frankiales bacterium]|nr:zinc-ribbon domain-containing protein [Frankiales bacterium]